MAAVGSVQRPTQFAIPNISNDDLVSFFESHFSDAAVQSFRSDFFCSEKHLDDVNAESYQEQNVFYEDEDDGLGYYPDGVKRTLTDEQIAMFRHSEIETLKREKERSAERGATVPQQNLEADEIGDDKSRMLAEPTHQPNKSTKNKKKRKAGKSKNHEPKPDLRKRTWDVVEAGLDSLDYD